MVRNPRLFEFDENVEGRLQPVNRGGGLPTAASSCGDSSVDHYDGADRNFDKQLARRFGGQTNATVRCRVGWYHALVHAEVPAVESHEIRHGNLVDGGTMVAVFVGDDVRAGRCGKAL